MSALHRRIQSTIQILFVSIAAVASLSGCQGEPRVSVYPVSGKVSFRGEAPVGAQIVLHAVNPSAASDIAPIGTVKTDGSFAMTAYAPGDGAPPGEYVATVEWFKLVTQGEGAGARGPNVLPPQYANAATSPIRVSVKSSATVLPPIDIR